MTQLLIRLPLAVVLWAVAAATTTVVVPDLAGMLYPPSSAGRQVQFGDFSASYPIAYEFLAPAEDTIDCSYARLCVQLKISSVFSTDPFFLYRYDAKYPVVSATFDSRSAASILPLVPGNASTSSATAVVQPVSWWFQSNATTTGASTGNAVFDVMLRLRQRSQRLSARDQLLVHARAELVDSTTVSSGIEVYSVYGNQRVTHDTLRVDSKTLQISLSLTRDSTKRDVTLDDAYPLIAAASMTTTTATTTSGNACDACTAFLDVCQQTQPCRTGVLPCLIAELEKLSLGSSDSASGSAGDAGTAGVSAGSSGNYGGASSAGGGDQSSSYSQGTSSGSSSLDDAGSTPIATNTVDFLQPLATCVADVPITTWLSVREALLCIARSKCVLGTTLSDAGQKLPTYLRLANGTQSFVVTPITFGTDNVKLSIATRSIRSSTASPTTFAFEASASVLGMFIRSFVLQQAADVSVAVRPSTGTSSNLQVTLTYSNGLMLNSVGFYTGSSTTSGAISMLQDTPASAVFEYPASTAHPALDNIISELQTRLHLATDSTSSSTHSWFLAGQCLDCSAALFGCSREAVADHSCSYYTMATNVGKCLYEQLPPTLFKGLIQSSTTQRPIDVEISRCVSVDSTASDAAGSLAQASSRLACFGTTGCPFGPIELVQDTASIVLATTSYIQLIRLAIGSGAPASLFITFTANSLVVATSTSFAITSSDDEIRQIIQMGLSSTGIAVSTTSRRSSAEWTLEVVYGSVYFPGSFEAKAVTGDASADSSTVTQLMMKGTPELRVTGRDQAKIFKQSSTTTTTTSPPTSTPTEPATTTSPPSETPTAPAPPPAPSETPAPSPTPSETP